MQQTSFAAEKSVMFLVQECSAYIMARIEQNVGSGTVDEAGTEFGERVGRCVIER